MALRVFLVEDAQNMQVLLRELVDAVGGLTVVDVAINEAEANLWLAEHPDGWDLAIVDLVLDQGSGFGVLPRAASGVDQKVVVFSSYVTGGIREHCCRLGAHEVFDKSNPGELIGWLSEQVKTSR